LNAVDMVVKLKKQSRNKSVKYELVSILLAKGIFPVRNEE